MRLAALTVGMMSSFAFIGTGQAQVPAKRVECFDALVVASVIQQTPTRPPSCGPGCFPMRWPWISKIDIERVLQGNASLGPVTVEAMQHNQFSVDHGGMPWRLRRNKHGGFNVLTYGTATPAVLCAKGSAAAEPVVSLGRGQTLEDLIAYGEREYGPGPKECCLANQWTGRARLWLRERARLLRPAK